MIEFWSLVLAGAVSGGLYTIMASGLVLTYQASGVFNLGQGAVAFVTALVYFQLHSPDGLGLPILPAAIIAILFVAPALGVLLDLVLFRRLASAPVAARLVGTLGVLIALPAAAFIVIEAINGVFGSTMPEVAGDAGVSPPGIGPTPPTTWSISKGIAINSDQLAVLVAAAIAALGLWFLMRHTRLGLETRAGVDRPVLARLRGIDTDRSSRIIWALSTLLAGCAGVLIAPLFDLSAITFHMIVFTSFTAAVAARLRSVPLAFAAGLALGVVQNLVHGYAPDFLKAISGFRSSVPFILLFVLLFFVQGRDGRAAGSVAEDAPGEDPLAGMNPWRRRAPWILAGSLLCAYALFVANGYWIGILNRGLVLSLVFLSLVVVTGIGGMINLAQATFVTVGGFTAGWLVNHQWPSTVPVLMDNGRFVFWVAVVVAIVVTAAVGLLVALPSIRLGGLTLALATLALAFIGDRLVFQLEGVRNGSRGWSLSAPKLGPFDLAEDRTMFIALALIVLVCIWIVGNLARSATGRALLALRSSPEAAAASGVDPTRTKLVLFAVSAGLAGFAGAWFARGQQPDHELQRPSDVGTHLARGRRHLRDTQTRWRGSGRHRVLGPAGRAARNRRRLGSSVGGHPGRGPPDHRKRRDRIAAVRSRRHHARPGTRWRARSDHQGHQGPAAGQGHPGPRRNGRRLRVRTRHEGAVPREPRQVGILARARSSNYAVACAGYGEVEVLHGLSLQVMPGEVVAVLGANGAGKSTLCGVIAGTVELRSGEVLFEGTEMTDTMVHMRAREGVVLAPEARGIFPGLSVDDNLAVRLRTESAQAKAKRRFPILAERHGQTADLLSGGEQQQLAMAAVLADPPKIFLADEPSLGLSPMATISVFEALAEMRGTRHDTHPGRGTSRKCPGSWPTGWLSWISGRSPGADRPTRSTSNVWERHTWAGEPEVGSAIEGTPDVAAWEDSPMAELETLDESWERALAVVAHPDDMEYGAASAGRPLDIAGQAGGLPDRHGRRGRHRRHDTRRSWSPATRGTTPVM